MRFIITALGFLLSVGAYAADAPSTNFAMTTNAFLDTGALPTLYTCDSKDVSPQLSWINPPPKTQSFALIVSDPDAPDGTWYHWVVYNLSSKTTELAENAEKLPAGAISGKNSWGKTQYNGPCPPKGSIHNYEFTLYALDTKLPPDADTKKVMDEIKKHTIKKAQLTTVYSRWLQ
jgi:Raf kinase inhibitor-like YbhB/YbcL family protein